MTLGKLMDTIDEEMLHDDTKVYVYHHGRLMDYGNWDSENVQQHADERVWIVKFDMEDEEAHFYL